MSIWCWMYIGWIYKSSILSLSIKLSRWLSTCLWLVYTMMMMINFFHNWIFHLFLLTFGIGSDGTTYINQCHLKYESCNKQQNIRIASNGTCGKFSFMFVFINLSKRKKRQFLFSIGTIIDILLCYIDEKKAFWCGDRETGKKVD